jgi:F-type H+-transporting ATPase subunit delta
MAALRTKQLAAVLLDLTNGATEEESRKTVKEFAAYLAKKGLLKKAGKIMEEYATLYNTKHSVVDATVTLVARLDEKNRMDLREALKKKHDAREVHILEKVDQRLIGGMKIQIGDTVYDSSIQNSLNQLQAQLLK